MQFDYGTSDKRKLRHILKAKLKSLDGDSSRVSFEVADLFHKLGYRQLDNPNTDKKFAAAFKNKFGISREQFASKI